MIERKDKLIRIRVIGGSGIFDSIVNILKKPIVSKLLTSAGKSVASVLGERLVNRMMPPAAQVLSQPPPVGSAATQQQVALPQQQVALSQQAPEVTQPPLTLFAPQAPLQSSRRAQELIERYKAKHTPPNQPPGLSGPQGTAGTAPNQVISGAGVPTIQEYVKSAKRGAGIKEIL